MGKISGKIRPTEGFILCESRDERKGQSVPLKYGEDGIVERLEWVRHYFGKSQKDFAESIAVMPSAYNNWCRGRQIPSLDCAVRVKRRYGISLDFLYFGETRNLPERIRNAWESRAPG